MNQAAPQAAAAAEAAEVWCETCGQPLTVGGWAGTIAVHTATGDIFGADGHVAGPTDDPALRDEALHEALKRDYPGWRAWVSDLGRWWAVRLGARPLAPVALEADTAAGLRDLLAADAWQRNTGPWS